MKHVGDARSFANGFLCGGVLIAGVAVTTHGAFAEAAITALQGAVACAGANACVSGTNTDSGPGVAGTSATGRGVSGTSRTGKGIDGVSTSAAGVKGASRSGYGVEAVSTKNDGLWATTTSGPAAVMGTSSPLGGFGVYGYTAASPYGYALFGNAPNGGFGVYGASGNNGDAVVGDALGAGDGTTGISSSGIGARGVSSAGAGMQGSSNASYGVVGSTTSGLAGVMGQAPGIADYGVYGFNTANQQGVGGFGVVGVAEARGTGVSGMSSSGDGYGVFGYASDSGIGTYGSSTVGDGVVGVSGAGYGVLGTSGSSTGVYATSQTGDAIDATSTNGFGISVSSYQLAAVNASSQEAAGVYATSNSGFGIDTSSYQSVGLRATSRSGNGLEAFSTFGAAIIGQTFSTAPTIQGYSIEGGYSFAGYDYSTGTNTFYVDDLGNIGYTGNLNNYVRVRGGTTVKTFAPKTATPTVEDEGTAQLVDGEATVHLDPIFAASMDSRATYHVFITPGGDTNGLYVPQKGASGFVVRESKGGRSTASFDYRIVATAIGQAGQRMSVATIADARPRVTHVSAPHVARVVPALRPRLPRKPRTPELRVPHVPQLALPRPPSQTASAPRDVR